MAPLASLPSVCFRDFGIRFFAVRPLEEMDEEEEVAHVHAYREERIVERSVARFPAKIDNHGPERESKPQKHLNNLRRSYHDCDRLGHLHLERPQRVVPVHEGMDEVVHADHPTSHPVPGGVTVRHAEHGEEVMVPVKKHQRLFAQYYEHGIAEFQNFRRNKEPGPEAAAGRAQHVTVVAH